MPYAECSTTSDRARAQIEKLLTGFGCSRIMLHEELPDYRLRVAFEYRGRSAVVEASAAGWADLYRRAHPRRKGKAADYEERVLKKARVAVAAALRDWLKGQITAVEAGVLAADRVFLAHLLTVRGTVLGDEILEDRAVVDLLPPARSSR